jgi:FtsP/CotA-like multicopper oxidase with cupredoxin domain
MWGLFCSTTTAPVNATCTSLKTDASGAFLAQSGTSWQPPLITVTSGTSLTVTLGSGLPVPTSLMIVGQLGGGLGSGGTSDPASNFPHSTQTAQWPIAGSNPPAAGDPTFTPPNQGPRVRSFGAEVASGNAGTALPAWSSLKPGTYLIESGTHPSIQGSMGLYGVLRVIDASATNAAYPGVTYDKDVPVLLSEIDPAQNQAVELFEETVAGCTSVSGSCSGTISATAETTLWVGGPAGCGTAHTCYPPAVNYDPRYYLINGVAFDKSNVGASSYAVPAAAATGNVLLRFVNAGLRMHVPSVVGLDLSLIAEDGNVLPGIPRQQNEVSSCLPANVRRHCETRSERYDVARSSQRCDLHFRSPTESVHEQPARRRMLAYPRLKRTADGRNSGCSE